MQELNSISCKSEEENSEEANQEIVSPESYIKHPLQNRSSERMHLFLEMNALNFK